MNLISINLISRTGRPHRLLRTPDSARDANFNCSREFRWTFTTRIFDCCIVYGRRYCFVSKVRRPKSMAEDKPQKELQSFTSADRIRQLNEVDKVRRPNQLMGYTVTNIFTAGCYAFNSFRRTCNPGSYQCQTGLFLLFLPRTRRITRLAQGAIQRSYRSIFCASIFN
jgi:hypothetical protein